MIYLTKIKKEDIPQIVEVHMQAFKGFINILAGRNYIKRFIEWFTENKNCIALVAKDKSKCIGYVIGAKVGYQKKINKDLMYVACFGLLQNPLALFNRKLLKNIYQRAILLFKEKEAINENTTVLYGDVISLVGIAVINEYKGKYVAKQLILEFENLSKEKKFDFMRLSVHSNNIRAKKFYENSGWLFLNYSSNDVMYYYKKLQY